MTLMVLTVNSPVKTLVALQLSWDNSLLNRTGSNWPLSYSNRRIHTNGLSQLSSQGVSVWNRHPNYPQPAEAIHAGPFLVPSWQWGMKKNSIHPRRYLIFSANSGRILSFTWSRVLCLAVLESMPSSLLSLLKPLILMVNFVIVNNE